MKRRASLPRVSVLTPSYNQARWLPDNLRSVAAQTYPNIEHVVMDGASTDGSVEILAAAKPAVVWQSETDVGQSDALNRAFERSSGEILGWLNSDDAYFSRDAVTAAVDVFRARPEVGVVYGHAALINAAGEVLHVLWTPPYSRKLLRSPYNPITQPTVFIRRSAVGRPFFVDRDFHYMMDRELWLYLSERTAFHRVDRILAVDRHHPGRKSYNIPEVGDRDHRILAQRYRVAGPGHASFRVKLLKIALRLVGATKIGEAIGGGDAFSMPAVSRLALMRRQLGQLRRQMPTQHG